MKIDPCFSNSALQKLAYNRIPGLLISSEFLHNFKLRALTHHEKYPKEFAINDCEVKLMLLQFNLNHYEIESIKDPLKMLNFEKLHCNMMTSDTTTWKRESYLQQYTHSLPGFNYQIHYAKDGYPEGHHIYDFIDEDEPHSIYLHYVLGFTVNNFNKLGWSYFITTIIKFVYFVKQLLMVKVKE